jgi:hypothetical protein
MPWDDDLEQLSQRARDILGNEAYHDAWRRAMAIAVGRGKPVAPDSFAGKLLLPEALEHTTAISLDVVSAALKTELRRLLTLH